jgi:hypothetical protein
LTRWDRFDTISENDENAENDENNKGTKQQRSMKMESETKNGRNDTIHKIVIQNIRGKGRRVYGHRGRKPVGILVAKEIEGVVRFGWAKANLDEGETFDLERGLRIATNRIYSIEGVPICCSLTRPMRRFVQRARRYFKEAETFATVNIMAYNGAQLDIGEIGKERNLANCNPTWHNS